MSEDTFDAGEGFDAVEAEAETERQAQAEAEAEAATTAALKVMIADGHEEQALALAKPWGEVLERWTRNAIEAKRAERDAEAEASFKNAEIQPEAAPKPYQIQKKRLIDDLELKVERPTAKAADAAGKRRQLDELVAQETRRLALFLELADVFENDNSVERSK
jgi:hypothetical protein